MIELIFTITFVVIVFLIGILSKKILYVNQHELSIENQLNKFNDNFKTIDAIDKEKGIKLGLDHLYK